MFKRLIYLAYYLKQLNWQQFFRFLDYTAQLSGRSKFRLLLDCKLSVFAHNISLLEYFQFHFYNKNKQERKRWAGTGYMYEYQLRMNPRSERHILDDKTQFYKHYGDFFIHQVADLDDLRHKPGAADAILNNPSGKLVCKVSDGKCGKGVMIRPTSDFNKNTLIQFMETKGYDLVEEFLIQHPDLQTLSPSAVNTIRIFTQLNNRNEVDILGCRLRISVNSPVDNMAAGNMAAVIDEETGIVTGSGVYSDITKAAQDVHPITGVEIRGFQIPFWQACLDLVKKAALSHPQNRSIGWDIVITDNGPGLIEGNHDWCKLLWQLPVNKGLKPRLKEYYG